MVKTGIPTELPPKEDAEGNDETEGENAEDPAVSPEPTAQVTLKPVSTSSPEVNAQPSEEPVPVSTPAPTEQPAEIFVEESAV